MKKVTILTGFYGSGKSEFAIQYALKLSSKYNKVYIADLDVINLYFRSREQEEFLNSKGIEILGNILGSDAAIDVPHISANIYKPLFEEGSHLIIDLAGTENGLKILNSLFVEKEFSYDMFVVINALRDKTETKEQIKDVLNLLNTYTKYNLNGLINNSNLLGYEEETDVVESFKVIKDSLVGSPIPIKYNILSSKFMYLNLENKFEFSKLYLKKEWQ